MLWAGRVHFRVEMGCSLDRHAPKEKPVIKAVKPVRARRPCELPGKTARVLKTRLPWLRTAAQMRTPWLLLAIIASTQALPQLTNETIDEFADNHSLTLLQVCTDRCTQLPSIDIEGVGYAASDRRTAPDGVRRFEKDVLLLVYAKGSQAGRQTSNATFFMYGRRWDAYRGGTSKEDMVWWLKRLAEGRDPVADERLGLRPGLFVRYDAWGEWSLRLGPSASDPPVYELDDGALQAVAGGADERLWVVFFYSDRSLRDTAAKPAILKLAARFRDAHGTSVAVAAHNARIWPEAARLYGRVVVSETGPKVAFAALQNGEWLNGAMALPRELDTAIYGWAARLSVGGLPAAGLSARPGPGAPGVHFREAGGGGERAGL